MTSLAPVPRRRIGRHVLVLLGPLCLIPVAVSAEEPLFIRIRPLPDAETARTAREALWARRQAHARAVIESVCTGCLGAWKPTTEPPRAPMPDNMADLTVRIGVELDPGPVASDLPDSATPERLP